MRLLFSILLLLIAAPALAATGSYYIGPNDGVDLRLRPDTKASVSGHLDGQTKVKIIKRERNWTKIQTADHRGVRGWVPSGAVRKSSASSSSGGSSSFFSSFASMFRSSGSQDQKTAVLGVRGLDSGDASSSNKEVSEKSLQIVEWMDTLKVPESEVATFVKKGRLKP